MKIRSGFISNSSSSSFIIGTKTPLTEKMLLDKFGVSESSPLWPFVREITEWIINNIKQYSPQDCFSDLGEIPDEFNELYSNGMFVYYGHAHDDGSHFESGLCEMDLNYKDENFVIKKEGGY